MSQVISRKVSGPVWRLDNYEGSFTFFNARASLGKSDALFTAGWEPSVTIFGIFVATVVIRTSPDGRTFVPVVSTTAPGLFGRNQLIFPAFAMEVEITSYTSGQISATFCGERRHR